MKITIDIPDNIVNHGTPEEVRMLSTVCHIMAIDQAQRNPGSPQTVCMLIGAMAMDEIAKQRQQAASDNTVSVSE